jgi:hypothetical protein
MLVKISNDTKEFEDKMNHLKMRLGLKVTSKVAEHCVENFADLDDRNTKNIREIERLEDKLATIRDALFDKSNADKIINEALKE